MYQLGRRKRQLGQQKGIGMQRIQGHRQKKGNQQHTETGDTQTRINFKYINFVNTEILYNND